MRRALRVLAAMYGKYVRLVLSSAQCGAPYQGIVTRLVAPQRDMFARNAQASDNGTSGGGGDGDGGGGGGGAQASVATLNHDKHANAEPHARLDEHTKELYRSSWIHASHVSVEMLPVAAPACPCLPACLPTTPSHGRTRRTAI